MMDASDRSNPSLWWKLSWQLSLVITAVVATVIIGLCVWAATIMSPDIAMEETIGSVVAEAAWRNENGGLILRETPRLTALHGENATLWYVAATTDGSSVSYGAIPPAYAELAQLVHLFNDADIRGSAVTSEIATVENAQSAVGEVRVLFGGVADKGSPVLALLSRAYPIYVSLLAIALPAIFLTVPQIVRHALATVSDVAQKAAEIEPRRPQARLPADRIPKEIAPLVHAFNGALERLENEFNKRERFLIDAAHELRTPIAIMQTRIDGMPDGQERHRLLGDAARLAHTAEQLLAFERNDQMSDVRETVNVADIAHAVVADLAPLAIRSGYQISFQSEAEHVERLASPSGLERAISNLVRNAIDYGGGAGAITVAVSADGRVSVRDEGPGIPAEHQELVFEPFYRVTPSSKGAGLGLSLVKQIVANHDGQVDLESDPGGTKVTIRL